MNEIKNRRVLVIDDNRAIHDDFKKILGGGAAMAEIQALEDSLFEDTPRKHSPEQESFEIDSAFQGQDGLAMVRQACNEGRPYAVAFIDVRMPPGWDGIETTSEIWKIDPDLQVVICTAYSDYSWSDMMAKLGRSDRLVVLKKPFDNIEVAQLAETLSTKWVLSREVRRKMQDLESQVQHRTEQLYSANEKLVADLVIRKQAELRLAAFASLGNRLNTAPDAKTAAEIIVEVADQLLGWDACVCDLYSPQEDRLHPVLAVDIVDGKRTECDAGIANGKLTGTARKVVREGGQLILRDNPDKDLRDSLPFGDTTRRSASILYVPIRNGATPIGLLSIQSYKSKAYDQHSLDTLQSLADHCGGALNRIKSAEALHQTELQLRQSQKMEAIGQLASGVAHDFNNLLAVILGNAEFAMGEVSAISAGAGNCLKDVIQAADRAANLTRQLLAFGRKQVVRAEPLDLNKHINHLSNMLLRILGEDIQLRCTYADDLPLVHADPGMLDQTIMNLVVNSRDAMPSGGIIQLTTRIFEFDHSVVRLHPEGRPGRFVSLSVADTGTGIAPEHLSHIFEPFFTTKGVGKGTGLGLATVFGIAKQHRGWVEVTSNVGVGTTFQIFLPALEQGAGSSSRSKAKSVARGGHETILLVEDDAAVRRITRRVLEEAGYRPLEAAHGREALDLWEKHGSEIDLLVTDVVMPGGMNGRDLAECLTAIRPALKVVFMTGYSGEILTGGADVLRQTNSRMVKKPCGRDEFLRVVRDHLDDLGVAE